MKKLKKVLNSRKGFTIIELLIVVVIIGIILAFAFPSFGRAKQQAQGMAFDMARKRLYDSAVMFTIDFPNTEAVWASHQGGEKAIKGKEITKDNLHEAWYLYFDEYPKNPIDEEVDFTVHIHKDGEIDIFPENP